MATMYSTTRPLMPVDHFAPRVLSGAWQPDLEAAWPTGADAPREDPYFYLSTSPANLHDHVLVFRTLHATAERAGKEGRERKSQVAGPGGERPAV